MWEPSAGNYNFISTSWRPYDVISYVSDKIVGSESKDLDICIAGKHVKV